MPEPAQDETVERIAADAEPMGMYIPPDMQTDIQNMATQSRPVARQPYTNPPPWVMSLLIAALGGVFVLLLLAYPSLRRLPLLPGRMLFTPYLALVLPLLSAFWALIGIASPQYRRQLLPSLAGLALALLTLVAVLATFWLDPSRW